MTSPTSDAAASKAAVLDLNAGRREQEHPDGILVLFGANELTVPAELPLDVWDPLLEDDLDLSGIIRRAVTADTTTDGVIDALLQPGNTPRRLLRALHDCFRRLFGADQYELFMAERPSVQDYARLVKGLVRLYGVGLGEVVASLPSSGSSGATSSTTSDASTSSTPEPSGVPSTEPADQAAEPAPDSSVYVG